MENERLIWIEGIDVKFALNERKQFLKCLERLKNEPYVDVDIIEIGAIDLRIYSLEYIEHSYSKYYIQYNKISGKSRIIITYPPHQKPDVSVEHINIVRNNAIVTQNVVYQRRNTLVNFDIKNDTISFVVK